MAVCGALLVAAAAQGAATRPAVSLSRASGAPGTRVVLAAHGFVPHARFRVTVSGRRVRRGRFGARGGTRGAFRVPGRAPGRYRVRVFTRGTVRSLRFRIRTAPANPSPALPEPQPAQPAAPAP